MKVIKFTLSGVEYRGEEAQRLFEIVLPYGAEEIVTVSRVKPERVSGRQYYVYADVSGVSASWDVGFGSRDEMEAWVKTVGMPEPTEAHGVACYRALIGYKPEAQL